MAGGWAWQGEWWVVGARQLVPESALVPSVREGGLVGFIRLFHSSFKPKSATIPSLSLSQDFSRVGELGPGALPPKLS